MDGVIGSYTMTGSPADWHHIRIIAQGSSFEVLLDGDSILNLTNTRYTGSHLGFYSYRAESQFDNLRVYPDDAIVTSQSYDPKTRQVTKHIDANGISTVVQYDELNRPVRTINADGKILSEQSRYLSRDGNADTFSNSDPNASVSASYSNGLPTDGLVGYWRLEGNATDASGQGNDGAVNGATDDRGYIGRGMHFDGSNDYVEVANDASLKTLPGLTLAAWVYPDNAIASYDIILNKEDEYEIAYKSTGQLVTAIKTDAQTWFWTGGTGTNTMPKNEWTHVAVTWDGLNIREYCDGVLKRTSTQFGNTTYDGGNPVKIGRRSHASPTYHWEGNIDEVLIYDRALSGQEIKAIATPLVASVYTDGLGRGLQSHSRNGDNDVITQTSYNSIGKVDKQYQPQELSNKLHIYKTSLTGSYELSEYFDDPGARIMKQTHSDNTVINYAYNSESFEGQTYRYQEIKDETGRIARSYSDKFGNSVGGRDAIGTADEIKWLNEFDILGNVTTAKSANFFGPPSGTVAADWDSDLKYSTLGQLVEQTTPDEGMTKFVYDDIGNLRYSQNALQAVTDDFTVTYYDKLGRVTLIGEEKDFNWTTTPPLTSNTTYGKDADEWKVKNAYDEIFVTGADNFGQGQLTKVEVNDDADDAPEHTTLYVYDKFGNLTEKRLTIDGGSPITEKIITHIYDLLGREIQLTYPSGNVVLREFDSAGRLKKIVHAQ